MCWLYVSGQDKKEAAKAKDAAKEDKAAAKEGAKESKEVSLYTTN